MLNPTESPDINNVGRITFLEQSTLNIAKDIKDEIKCLRAESKDEAFKIWNKLEALDHRINDNYKYLDQKIDSRFSDVEKKFLTLDSKISTNFKMLLGTIMGLYATIFGGMIAKVLNFM